METNGFLKKGRLIFTYVFLGLISIAIILKFFFLAFGNTTSDEKETVNVERGSIVDRNGKPLAVRSLYYHMGMSPSAIKNPADFAETIAPILNMNSEELLDMVESDRNSKFKYIKKNIQQDQYEEIKNAINKTSYKHLINFERNDGRIYPENDLASQLIGHMGTDSKGQSGIELKMQSYLQPIPQEGQKGTVFGDNIFLTIDSTLQYKLEQISKQALEETQAESLMLIAADATNGEILSYISLPAANLNDYSSSKAIERLDRPSVTSYEPGSVFKIFSTAAFLDSHSITKDQEFVCDGVYSKTTGKGETVRINCLEHHGTVTMREALKYSCNDALAQMADTILPTTFLEYIHAFGFGEPTNVELPSETSGSVKDQNSKLWSARSKPTMSIGQEISVSALQMVQAATVIANKGRMVKLTFIHRITDKNGNVLKSHEPEYGPQVIRQDTADYVLSCMETTAQSGTGTRAALGDVSLGVKTGTAQMADPVRGGYSETDFLSNCMAIFPVEDPKIILYIVIQKAKGETYAGRIVAPVIAKAADEIIDYMGMVRASAEHLTHNGQVFVSNQPPIRIDSTVPDFVGSAKRDIIPVLNREDINFKISGEGWVVRQWPAPGTPVSEGMTIELYLE